MAKALGLRVFFIRFVPLPPLLFCCPHLSSIANSRNWQLIVLFSHRQLLEGGCHPPELSLPLIMVVRLPNGPGHARQIGVLDGSSSVRSGGGHSWGIFCSWRRRSFGTGSDATTNQREGVTRRAGEGTKLWNPSQPNLQIKYCSSHP